MLEVIEKGSGSAEHPTPLLFVHGGWHAAWCWENFLDFFADAGYRAVALSLRGHGASPTSKPLHRVSIADYLDDVAAVADELGARRSSSAIRWAASSSSATWKPTAFPPRCWWGRCRRRACSGWRCGSGAAGRR